MFFSGRLVNICLQLSEGSRSPEIPEESRGRIGIEWSSCGLPNAPGNPLLLTCRSIPTGATDSRMYTYPKRKKGCLCLSILGCIHLNLIACLESKYQITQEDPLCYHSNANNCFVEFRIWKYIDE